MAYLSKGNKPDLLSVEEEVKIILDRVISDRKDQERSKQEEKEREERSIQEEKEREERSKQEEKEREERGKQEEREEREREREERMAREARQHELELRKLELSQENQPLNDESGRRVEIGPKIHLTQITTKFDEKHDEISLYLINFERKAELAQVSKKDWVAYLLVVLPAELSNMLAREPTERANNYDFVEDLILKRREIPKKNSDQFQGGVNYSGARPKETPKDFKSKLQIKKEPVHEKNHEKDFEKRRQLRCYECGSYSHLRPQCDKLKKNYETVASNETVRNGTDVLAPYTSLGTVNGIEMHILRDTQASLDLICKKYVKPSMFINETVWI
ncbi:SCAN box domain-containing protein [Trichonephila clavipes]|nr:SCAN box domain-containing protein [Trichonephila clavipes]